MITPIRTWRAAIIACLIGLLPGLWIAHNLHAGPIAAAQAQLDSNQTQLLQTKTLVARIPALRATYAKFVHLYLPPTQANSYWQAAFVRAFDRAAAQHHLEIQEITWTTQPLQAPPIPTDLLGADSTATSFAALFADLGCEISINGRWRDLLPLISDLPKQRIMLAVSAPAITTSSSQALQLKLRGDLLIAHVAKVNPTIAPPASLRVTP